MLVRRTGGIMGAYCGRCNQEISCPNCDVKIYQCVVHNCLNNSDQGNGILFKTVLGNEVWICVPCWDFIDRGTGEYSQVYRNAFVFKKEIEGKINE
jgi:hypothetical protein